MSSDKNLITIYPEPKKGELSEDTSRYGISPRRNGPKSGDPQRTTLLFGIVFFVIFTLGITIYFGLLDYL